MSQDLPEALDVIAVGAHPDDVEIGCGGTLATLVDQGYRVGIVDLTDGEPTPLSPGPEVRLKEANRAAEILGVHVRVTLDLSNRRLFDTYESRVELAKVFRKYRPRIVLGIAGRTPMASPDHWETRQITDAAVFYSRLTKWDDQFDHLPVHTVTRQFWYPLGIRHLTFPEGENHFVSDISQALERKIEAVRAYETQFPPKKQHILELLRMQNQYFGVAAGYEAGELFLSQSVIGVGNLIETFL